LALRFRSTRTRDTRGQALVEFALVLPLLVLIMMGVMQFGLLFWAQITLTQVARDTGRWVASQESCLSAAVNVGGQANAIAARSTLFGWSASNQLAVSAGPTWTEMTPPPNNTGICPPSDNREIWNVTFELSHTVPVFLPVLGDTWTLRSEVQFRMEPAPR
jgi:Flp pilus assembly protein TadG